MHFQEIGLNMVISGILDFQLIMEPNHPVIPYFFNLEGQIDFINITPLKLIFFFTRPTDIFLDNGFHFWIGGAYDIEVGNAKLSYCEQSYNYNVNFWT